LPGAYARKGAQTTSGKREGLPFPAALVG
jgi:hypothetical protein